jgi:CMP-N,N'-diacetyllegionaminic acid synthase
MNRLCTICARGGSKGVKNKNTRLIAGKPLIAHSILQANASGLFQSIAVSSDSEDILTVAREWGADHLIHRPSEMACDTAAKIPAIRHCFQSIERNLGISFDILVDLDVTSPLRNIQDIINSVKLLESKGVSNIITGCSARRSPYFNLVEETNLGVVKLSKQADQTIVRRQDAPKCYDLNASIYVWKREAILNENNSVFFPDTKLYVMPENRSIDIDSEVDFQFVEFLMMKKNEKRS